MQMKSLAVVNGKLKIGGACASGLAKTYGTPLYVMDEAAIRESCRAYTEALDELYPNSMVCYASKAFSARAIYEICAQEGLGADVVSLGELKTALAAGMDPDKLIMHGNNKTREELYAAARAGIYAVCVDGLGEIDELDGIAAELNKTVRVQLRLNPGVEAHTHHFVQTAMPDSKFGFAVANGEAMDAVQRILDKNNLRLTGLHCHIGSQIFETAAYRLAVENMVAAYRDILVAGAPVTDLNIGGGAGVAYVETDKVPPIRGFVEAAAAALKEELAKYALPYPKLILEPGRSIVAEAGVTLYTVGGVKDIKGVKKYVFVDGGMYENPRYVLYQSKYSAVLCDRASEPASETVAIAGKCCESGDIVVSECKLAPARKGDILAVLCTGAYNYSMASNYNRNPVPPVVLVNKGKHRYIVKPQTVDDILARDVSLSDDK